ncbi:MAG: hypothetical protein Kow00105_04770 [Phycisphaeraceae bacterium]
MPSRASVSINSDGSRSPATSASEVCDSDASCPCAGMPRVINSTAHIIAATQQAEPFNPKNEVLRFTG